MGENQTKPVPGLRLWFPQTKAGVALVSLLTALGGLRLLGEQGARIGAYNCPRIELWWIILLAGVSFLVLPHAASSPSLFRVLVVAFGLFVLGWPLARWHRQLRQPASPLTAIIDRLDDQTPKGGRSVRLDSLRVENRRILSRLAGRRRNLALEVDGFLRVPQPGKYRFQLACDERCTLAIDGQTVLDQGGAASADVLLEQRLHRLWLRYEQRGGPAFLSLRWDQPAFVELLPLEHYLGDRAELLAPGTLRRKQMEARSVLLACLAWWLVTFSLVVRAAESRRGLLEELLSSWHRARERRLSAKAALSPFVAGLQSRFRETFDPFLGIAGVAAGFVLSGALLPSEIEISATRGDWKSVTEGFQLSGSPVALGGGRRAGVHFHDLDGRAGQVRLLLSARDAHIPVQLTMRSNHRVLLRSAAPPHPAPVTVPFEEGTRQIEIGIEAEAAGNVSGALFLVHRITLLRRENAMSRAARVLPTVLAAITLLLLMRGGRGVRPALGAVLAAALAAGAVMVLADPVAAAGYAKPTRDVFRIGALALLWLFVLTGRKSRLSAFAAVAGTVGLLYLPSLRYGFLTDDFFFGRPLTWRELSSTLYDQWDPRGLANAHYRPVLAFSLALDYWLWRAATEGYHFTNLMVHVANGLLAFALFKRLRLSPAGALAGALVWCAHPLGAASACWSNQRTDGIMAVFYLGSLLLLAAPEFQWRHSLGSLALGMGALGSKEMAVTLPLVAYLMLRSADLTRAKWRYPSVAMLLSATILYVGFWIGRFPSKAGLATRLASELPSMGEFLTHPLVNLYPTVFLPGTYRWWSSIQIAGMPWWYLISGLMVWPAAWGIIRLSENRSFRERMALLGGAWPLVVAFPLLGLKGGVDLYRLGLLLAVGFGLTWGVLIATAEGRWPRSAAWLTVPLAVWLGLSSIRSGEAWGPGGFMMTLGTRWKVASPEWQSQIGPEMKHLFFDQLERVEHARRWVYPSARESLDR